MRPWQRAKEGRHAYLALYQYYLDASSVDNMSPLAEKNLKYAVYKSESKNFTFENYIRIHMVRVRGGRDGRGDRGDCGKIMAAPIIYNDRFYSKEESGSCFLVTRCTSVKSGTRGRAPLWILSPIRG